MRHEKEVESSLNALYLATYREGEGPDPLVVGKVAHKSSFLIFRNKNGVAKLISADLIDKYIDGSLENTEVARKDIVSILEELRKPPE